MFEKTDKTKHKIDFAITIRTTEVKIENLNEKHTKLLLTDFYSTDIDRLKDQTLR